MTDDSIYTNQVQYIRKGKSRNCKLQIEVIRRCQDKLVAVLSEISGKDLCYTFDIFGYECNNDCVSLIANSDLYRIKLESLDAVQKLTLFLNKYIKDVSFKFLFVSCTPPTHLLQVNEWYTLHVQIYGICFTSNEGTRLVSKWNRSNIGQCYILDNCLKIEIYAAKDKSVYSLFREERFAMEKVVKSIQNLKFELPLPRQERFTLIPRRSVSVDLRRVSTWGSTKERICRVSTYSTSRADDSLSNDESSSASTPCSPSCMLGTNETILSSTEYNDIDEKPEEMDELMFPIDSSDSGSTVVNDVTKASEYSDSNVNHQSTNSRKLVLLERFPYESDNKSLVKKSPETSYLTVLDQPTIHIHKSNVYEKSRNGACYSTINSLERYRKPGLASVVADSQSFTDELSTMSRSSDINAHTVTHMLSSSYNTISHSYSPSLQLTSSSSISATSPTTKFSEESPIAAIENGNPHHNYYNISNNTHNTQHVSHKYNESITNSDGYFNLSAPLSPNIKSDNSFLLESPTSEVTSLNYADLVFTPGKEVTTKYKKTSVPVNYVDINHHNTQVLKDLDNYKTDITYHKKKKKGLFRK